MNLYTKKINVGQRQIKSTVTREMVDDLGSYYGISGFYVKKDLIQEPLKNNIITFNNYNDEYYSITINDKLYERYKKILKVTKDEYLKKVFEQIEICEKNRKDDMMMMESKLIDELSDSINNQIINDLMKLKNK